MNDSIRREVAEAVQEAMAPHDSSPDTWDLTDDYITTSKGRRFYVDRPVFDPEEIAHSLGNLCRFAGHCDRFYSVAEHSVLVADIMAQFALGNPFEGLMHDATESVLADIVRPVKARLTDYHVVERNLDQAMRAQFKLPLEITRGCKLADWVAVVVEARQMMPSQSQNWHVPAEARDFAASYLKITPFLGLPPQHAGGHWLRHYHIWSERHV
jgi:hypothetical protein